MRRCIVSNLARVASDMANNSKKYSVATSSLAKTPVGLFGHTYNICAEGFFDCIFGNRSTVKTGRREYKCESDLLYHRWWGSYAACWL